MKKILIIYMLSTLAFSSCDTFSNNKKDVGGKIDATQEDDAPKHDDAVRTLTDKEWEMERAARDSIWELEKEENRRQEIALFYSLPLISQATMAEVAPAVRKWTDYYQIDLSQMREADQKSLYFTDPFDTTSIYFRGFSPKNDSPSLKWMEYAPDKQRYVDVGYIFIEGEDGKYYCGGWDDCQEIYLVDRKTRQQDIILWFGASEFAEAVFWLNNDIFLIVGYQYYSAYKRFIRYFDVPNKTCTVYELLVDEADEDFYSGYMEEVNIKEKGVIFM